jgi:hypothetical protein
MGAHGGFALSTGADRYAQHKASAGTGADKYAQYKASKPTQAEPESDWTDTAQDAIVGAGTGVTAGWDDELLGAVGAIGSLVSGDGKSYTQHRDEYRATKDQASARSPRANVLGQVAGGVGLTAATGGAGQAALLPQLLRAGALGAAQGLGNTDRQGLAGAGDLAEGATKGALVSAGLTGGLAGLGKGLSGAGRLIGRHFSREAQVPVPVQAISERVLPGGGSGLPAETVTGAGKAMVSQGAGTGAVGSVQKLVQAAGAGLGAGLGGGVPGAAAGGWLASQAARGFEPAIARALAKGGYGYIDPVGRALSNQTTTGLLSQAAQAGLERVRAREPGLEQAQEHFLESVTNPEYRKDVLDGND